MLIARAPESEHLGRHLDKPFQSGDCGIIRPKVEERELGTSLGQNSVIAFIPNDLPVHDQSHLTLEERSKNETGNSGSASIAEKDDRW